MQKKRYFCLIFPVVTLILELLPFGAVCVFANPEGEPWRKTFSYFDPTPFGYANFAPFLTAIATCVMVFLLVIYVLRAKENLFSKIEIVNAIAILLSLCPLLFGISYYTVVGGLITATLVSGLAVLCWFGKK